MTNSPRDPRRGKIAAEDVAWVARLHAVVDELAAPLVAQHREKLACKAGCADCCVDNLTVFRLEAARIEAAHPELLAEGEPHPEGACAFLDGEGRCRVYEVRPYVCRTQGLPLRWLEEHASRSPTGEDEDDEIIESRDVCPKNFVGDALEALEADAMWSLGPFEQRLADKQHAIDGGERVALRDLFANGGADRRRLPIVR